MTKKVLNVVQYVFLIIASFISIFPIFWMIIAAANKSVDVTRGTLLPGTYFLENMKTLLASDLQYLTAYKNSLIIAVVTTVLAMIVSSAAGYAFVVYRTRARERIFSIVLLSMMVPFAALMVPLFRLFSKFNSMGPLKVIGLNTPMSFESDRTEYADVCHHHSHRYGIPDLFLPAEYTEFPKRTDRGGEDRRTQ